MTRIAPSGLLLLGVAACGGRVDLGTPEGGALSTTGADGSSTNGSGGASGSGTGSVGTGGSSATAGTAGSDVTGGSGGTGGSHGTDAAGGNGATGGSHGSDAAGGNGGSGATGGNGADSGATGGNGGSDATGGSGGTGGSGPGGDAGVDDVACWSAKVSEVQPMQPVVSAAEACRRAAATGAPWSLGGHGDAGADPIDPKNNDGRALIVGRWIRCDLLDTPTGVEFGANGRWRLLKPDGAGGFLPPSSNDSSTRGYYALLGSYAQLIVYDDRGPEHTNNQEGGIIAHVDALDLLPEKEAMNFLNGTNYNGRLFPEGVYARIAPSPLNGRDNPPSVSEGTCDVVGTWDTDGRTTGDAGMNPPASFSFDSVGNFVAAPGVGADLCATHPMYGTYQLAPGSFELTNNVGMNLCHFSMGAGFKASFNADCTRIVLDRAYDNCTGGRDYLNYPSSLVRRR